MSTLANAQQVLKLIVQLQRDVSVSDVAQQLDMPKSSASRTLSQMCTYGFLDRDPVSKAYRPGSVVLEASYHFRGSHGALNLLEAQLDRIVAETGYTTYIDVLDGADSLVIQMRIGGGSLQVYTPPGSRLPAHATSVGRAILARLDDDEAVQLCSKALDGNRRNPNVPSTARQLRTRLAEIRRNGWSLSRGESIVNVAGISTSVMDPTTRQIYGLSIALPAQDLDEMRAAHFSKLIVEITRDIGVKVGDPYWVTFNRQ